MEGWGDEIIIEQGDGGRARVGSPALAVNKSSSKISKPLRKPLVQPKPAPPKIYNTDPTSFRNLVQELTGTATATAATVAPSSPAVSSVSRPACTRLQKIAPPPLKTGSHAQMTKPALPPVSPRSTKPTTDSASPFPKMLSPIPILSPHTFSPSCAPTPFDGMWPNPLDSPDTVALRRLAERMVENENACPNVNASSDVGSCFPWSPSMQACFNIASPGSGFSVAQPHAFGNVFAGLGVNDSPSARSLKDFSFPNSDYVSGLS